MNNDNNLKFACIAGLNRQAGYTTESINTRAFDCQSVVFTQRVDKKNISFIYPLNTADWQSKTKERRQTFIINNPGFASNIQYLNNFHVHAICYKMITGN